MTSLMSGTVLLTAVGLFSQLVGLFYRIVLSRLVGAETMGLYQLIMPVYSTLMSLTAVGLTVAAAALSARFHALGDRGAVIQTRNRTLALFLLITLPLGILLIALSDPISVHLLGDARTRLGLILLAPCVLLTGVENIQKHCFYGLGCVKPPAFTETAEQVIRTISVLSLLVLLLPRTKEETVGIIVAGMVVCEVFSALTLTILFRRWRRREPDRLPREQARWGQLISFTLPVTATSLLGTLLGAANAVLIPARLVSGGMAPSEAISSFGVLCGMTLPLLNLPTGFISALCLVLVPNLARKFALGDSRAVKGFLDRVMTTTSLLMAPAMALLAVIGPTVARSVFDEPSAGEHILLLAAGTLLTCWQSVLSGALNGISRQGLAARNAIVSDGVQLVFTYFAVPHRGLAGFGVGFLLSALTGAALNLISVLRCTRLHPRWTEWFLCPVLAAILSGMCARLLLDVTLRAGLGEGPACAGSAVLGVIVCTAALQAQGMLPRKERQRE